MNVKILKTGIILSLIFLYTNSFAQNTNIIFEFELNNDNNKFFNVDRENNLHSNFIILNLPENKLPEFTAKFKNNKGVIDFETEVNENNQIIAKAIFKKAGLQYFYNLFRNNGVHAIKVNGKTTKVKYLEVKTDILPEPVTYEFASDPNHIDYYNKQISDAEYKINWVQHNEEEIKNAIKNGWFEKAENTLNELKKEKIEFINNN